MSSSKSRKKLAGRKYAHVYMQQLQDMLLAMQVRVLRKQRDLSQAQLARLCGMKQARISLLENGRYSQWSLATLRTLAEAFDVGLDVRFVRFFELLDRMERESTQSLQVPKRADELKPEFTIVAVPSSVKEFEVSTFSVPVVSDPAQAPTWKIYTPPQPPPQPAAVVH